MLILKNGYMIDPASGIEGYRDILIDTDSEKIVRIVPRGALAEEMASTVSDSIGDVIDLTGQILAPGLVDVHVHFRDPGFTHKEDIHTGAAAAAKGGFTSVVLMANTKPAVDNAETLAYVRNKGKETGIHVYTCANVTMGLQGREMTDMEMLSAQGAAGFTDDGIPLMDERLLREALQRAAKCGKPVSLHEENPSLIKNNGVNAGKAAAYYGIGGSPREAEISMVERDLRIAVEEEADLSIQHISTKEAVELVRRAKKKSSHIYAEAAPHHFTLTEEAVTRHGTLAKMNPPLREEEDRLAIIKGLQDGTIDMIATDHAPHTAEEKGKGLAGSLMGVVGLETAFPVLYTHLVRTGILPLERLVQLLSGNPCRRFGLGACDIRPGVWADFTVFDLDVAYTIDPDTFLTMGRATPFAGTQVWGRCLLTVCDGRIAWRDPEVDTMPQTL